MRGLGTALDYDERQRNGNGNGNGKTHNATATVDPEPTAEGKERKKSEALELLDAILREDDPAFGAEFICDELGETFIIPYSPSGVPKLYAICDPAFKQYCTALNVWLWEKLPNPSAMDSVISGLDAIIAHADFAAKFGITVRHDKVWSRVGWREHMSGRPTWLEVNLGDDKGRTICVTTDTPEERWAISTENKVLFRQSATQRALPLPLHTTQSLAQLLRPHIRCNDEDFRLVLAWLLQAMNPNGPHPILILVGEQGSAKTSTAKLLRKIVDPSLSDVCGLPKSERDFAIAAYNSWVLCYDNISSLPSWLSDAFCRAATGEGFTTRELFKDRSQCFFHIKNPIILNGIEDFQHRSDLLSRALIVRIDPLAEKERRTERDLDTAFGYAYPEIVGALLNAVHAGMANWTTAETKLKGKLPRMADFATFAVAAETALGIEEGGFLESYGFSQSDAVSTILESSLLVPPLRAFVQDKRKEGKLPWEGIASQLLPLLHLRAGADVTRQRGWPHSARILGSDLRRLAPALPTIGLSVSFIRTGHDRDRLIRIDGTSTPEPEDHAPEPEDHDLFG
jgi:hypothetical protein